MSTLKVLKTVTKAVSSGSVQMMIGGIVAAVMPPQASILYKAATAVGSLVVAGFAGEKIDDYVERKLNDVAEVYEEVNDKVQENIDILKEKIKKEEVEA